MPPDASWRTDMAKIHPTTVCRTCFVPLFWHEEARVWVAARSYHFHPPHTHQPKDKT